MARPVVAGPEAVEEEGWGRLPPVAAILEGRRWWRTGVRIKEDILEVGLEFLPTFLFIGLRDTPERAFWVNALNSRINSAVSSPATKSSLTIPMSIANLCR